MNERSEQLFRRSRKVAPGGVHSDFRQAFPHFFSGAEGSKIVDVDGHTYIDYHMAFGPLILGHNHPKIVAAVKAQLDKADVFGMGAHQLELDVAEKITNHVPCAEMVRFCNSGSEATYHAIRIARSHTHRRRILKFEGSYHGWHDYVDIGVFPRVEEIGKRSPNSAGILEEAARNTIVLPYNDIGAVEREIKSNAKDLAAVIVEPILHSCGCILPREGFLEAIRELTQDDGVVLIFDEVITGFRHSLGGAQKILGVTPDLSVFAKAIANGFPAAAVCGTQDLMNELQPIGKVHMAGTYSGHPISMAAAKATIEELEDGSVHEYLERSANNLRNALIEIVEAERLTAKVTGFKSIFAIYFMDRIPTNYKELKLHNNEELFNSYCASMHSQGIFIPPQAYKRCHLSAAHTEDDLRRTISAARTALHHSKVRSQEMSHPTETV